MKIKMAGIAHEHAFLEDRERFAFSPHACAEAMKQIMEWYSVACVLFSTCNRTELWISYGKLPENEEVCSPFEILCRLKQVSPDRFRHLCAEREDEKAVQYLFELACGMHSRIFGEDQILTQVKQALLLARQTESTDTVLEKLFQSAVTAAKRVKTEAHLLARDTSVVEKMLEVLRNCMESERESSSKETPPEKFLQDTRCLVIGNGEMGRLMAARLLACGADVTMTLRQYRDGGAVIPCGCSVIPYQERLRHLPEYDIIASATKSPHHTLKYEDAEPVLRDGKHRILFDLAVPRDISARLSELPDVTLYNIDSLGTEEMDTVCREEMEQAVQILKTCVLEYKQWYYFREFVPAVRGIGRTVSLEIYRRLEHPVKKLSIAEEEKTALEKTTKAAAETVVSSMLYGLREQLPMELWESCFHALEAAMLESIRKRS